MSSQDLPGENRVLLSLEKQAGLRPCKSQRECFKGQAWKQRRHVSGSHQQWDPRYINRINLSWLAARIRDKQGCK